MLRAAVIGIALVMGCPALAADFGFTFEQFAGRLGEISKEPVKRGSCSTVASDVYCEVSIRSTHITATMNQAGKVYALKFMTPSSDIRESLQRTYDGIAAVTMDDAKPPVLSQFFEDLRQGRPPQRAPAGFRYDGSVGGNFATFAYRKVDPISGI